MIRLAPDLPKLVLTYGEWSSFGWCPCLFQCFFSLAAVILLYLVLIVLVLVQVSISLTPPEYAWSTALVFSAGAEDCHCNGWGMAEHWSTGTGALALAEASS